MDPYIAPETLDTSNPWYQRKIENLTQANQEYEEHAVVLQSLPAKIILQTTDTCNLNCPMCQIPWEQKSRSMEHRIFERVVEQLFPTLIELHPTNVGEPLMSPWFQRMCEAMEKYGVVLDLTTNGTLLTQRKLEWIAPIVRDIKISFDGATRETFEKIRVNARFEQVCNNVKMLVQRLQQVKIRRPVVAFQMTLMRSNFHELPQLIELAHSLGVERVKAYHLFSFTPHMDYESLMFYQDDYNKVLEQALQRGEALGIDLELAEPAQTQPQESNLRSTVCHLPWHEAWIDVDGSVYPCHSHGGDSAGDLTQQFFAEIWNADLYKKIRQGFQWKQPAWNCNGCGMNCQRATKDSAVPYDKENFLSTAFRQKVTSDSGIRWSGRMKQFDLTGRNWK